MSFVDAHTHMELLALERIPFDRINSVGELVSALENLPDDNIVAWGWDENKLGRPPTIQDLDRIKKPLLLLRKDAHVGVANRLALEVLGAKSEDGVLKERELWEAVDFFKPKGEEMKRLLFRALKKAKSMKILEVHDFVDGELAKIYASADQNLPIKVVLMPYYEHYREVLDLFRRRKFKNLKLGWVKLFVDGSVGARTAYLKEPYADKPNHRGILNYESDQIARIIEELEEEGLRISLHAIGDGAVEESLKAFEKVKPKLRYHRIEHALLVDGEQAIRARDMNLLLCMQPNFKEFFKDTYIKALGEERYRRLNPIRTLHRLGVDIIFGSDMMPFDPQYGIRSALGELDRDTALYLYGGWRLKGQYI